ncbi:MAG: DUF3857 domain-containing transglutaminase family protein [Candidatus Methylacidiphilales bacterium]|nr:DUF3857 domain-containing transglutaminase family protein [Candidatus Methylacidiphilales bacterium]
MRRILFFILCPAGALLAAAPEPAYRIAAPASWVEIHEASAPGQAPLDQIVDGVHRLLIERQCDPATASVYRREATQIVSETGIQNGSEVRLTFDPAFEQVTLHHLRVIRAGRTDDRTARAEIRVLQREEEMDYHLLDGRLMLSVHLEDIRVGDVVDWSWTITGVHPTMKGLFFDSFLATGDYPVQEMRLMVRVPANRPIQYRLHNGAPEPTIAAGGPGVVWSWHWTATKPWHDEPSQPSWSDEKPWIDLGEHARWAETAAWALPLYRSEAPTSGEWRQLVQACRAAGKPEQQVLYALRFVQDEIRYLGIEMGAGSHRPNPPSTVLQRRFGDCKDKSLLFITLLRELGLKAWPALVNTESRHTISDWLPSPYDFDHVVAALEWEGTLLFLDPTRTLQRGPLSQIYVEDYGRALLVREGESDLVDMHPTPESMPRTEVTESYDCQTPDGPTLFSVRTVYRGAAAEEARNDMASSGREKLQQDYLEYYAHTHRFIRMAQSLSWKDDPEANTVECSESYLVDGLWRTTESGSREAEFYPQMIRDLVEKPSQAVRRTPFSIDHPRDLRLLTRVNLWQPWNLHEETDQMDSPAYRLERKTSLENNGRTVVFLEHFRTKKDHVLPGEVKEHFRAVDQTLESIGHTLTFHTGKDSPAWPSWRELQLVLLVLFAALASAGWTRAALATTPPPLPATAGTSHATPITIRWLHRIILLGGLVACLRLVIHPAWSASGSTMAVQTDFALNLWLAASSVPLLIAARRTTPQRFALALLWTLFTLAAVTAVWIMKPEGHFWWLLQALLVPATALGFRMR